MLKNEYLIAKFGLDTAENGPIGKEEKETGWRAGGGGDQGGGGLPSRLHQHRFLQSNTHFSAFFKIYKIFSLDFQKNCKISQNFCINS